MTGAQETDDAGLRPDRPASAAPRPRWLTQRPVQLGLGVFVLALLSRTVWLPEVPLTPDPATTLWMALDGVREHLLPDHGLVSSYRAFQPPGLAWMAMPFLALSGGGPELAMIGFGVLNAASIALLVVTVGRRWGWRMAVPAGVFFIVGPDVYMSPLIWHPSLFTAATCLVLTAGIRLRDGSIWWAFPLAVLPGLYALIHYSGLVLYGSGLALLIYARRPLRSLVLPVAVAGVVTVVAWLPFALFEASRDWVDISTILQSADQQPGLFGKFESRAKGGVRAVLHLGQGWHGAVLLTPLLVGLPLLALLLSWRRKKLSDAVLLPMLVLAGGLAAQVLANMGARYDVLLLWLPVLYLLGAWLIAQIPVRALYSAAVVVVLALGTTSVVRAVIDTPEEQTLSVLTAAADDRPDLTYENLFTLNGVYLPCDPPYTWGVETWYLQEADERGVGAREALRAGAFADRAGSCGWRERLARTAP